MRTLDDFNLDFADLAKIFKALSDKNRLTLFTIIYEATYHCECNKDDWNEEACIKYLAESLNITMPTVSHHIKELVNAGLITTEKKGRWVQCSTNHKRLDEVTNFFTKLKFILK
ncbi:ArsR/SmtB family transcription factor [Thermodesulfobacteriota bacterium]